MEHKRYSQGNGQLSGLLLLNIQPKGLGTRGTETVPATPIPRSPIWSGSTGTGLDKGLKQRVTGLLERCERFQLELKGQKREVTSSWTSRGGEWAQAKEFLYDLNHKAAWRHSPLYQRRKLLISQRLLTVEGPVQAQDKRVILTTASPEPSGQAFLTIDHLTQTRLRALAQVSRREFGLQPLSREEVVRNLQKRDHPTMQMLERKSDRGNAREDRDTPDSALKPTQKRSLTQASNPHFPSFHPGKPQTHLQLQENSPFAGKLLPRLASETLILDQMVKSRLVKMQRTELLS